MPLHSPQVSAAKSEPRHISSLDGIRAFAVLAVMAVHAGLPGCELGWLGVDLFFVLSGFLITSLLAEEQARHHRISLPKFWGRRFLRLMPAYWLYVGSLTVSILIFHWGWMRPHGGWSPQAYIASLWLYFVNYAPMGGIWEHQTLTLHLWSLAVEEQFYFLWPVICMFALRLPRPSWVAWFLVAVVLFRLVQISNGDSRLDTRGLGITMGCAVALSLHRNPWPMLRKWLSHTPFRATILVLIGTAILIGTAFQLTGYTESQVRRVLLPIIVPLFSILTAMLWYGSPDRISRALSWKPLVFLGTISYGIYLYHMLAHFLTWEVLTPDISDWPRVIKLSTRLAVYFSLTLGIATLSYQLIEKRFLKLKSYLR